MLQKSFLLLMRDVFFFEIGILKSKLRHSAVVALDFTFRGRIDVDHGADIIRIDHFTEV